MQQASKQEQRLVIRWVSQAYRQHTHTAQETTKQERGRSFPCVLQYDMVILPCAKSKSQSTRSFFFCHSKGQASMLAFFVAFWVWKWNEFNIMATLDRFHLRRLCFLLSCVLYKLPTRFYLLYMGSLFLSVLAMSAALAHCKVAYQLTIQY